jgi:hypothetical protein
MSLVVAGLEALALFTFGHLHCPSQQIHNKAVWLAEGTRIYRVCLASMSYKSASSLDAMGHPR